MYLIDKKGIISKLNSVPKVIIELGCGRQKQIENSITIDMIDLPHIDIITDINKGLYFLPDNSVDEIYSFHFLEHVEKVEFIMSEIYRVLKPGGKKIGTVPHFSNPYFYSDYTHHNCFGLYSFCYFSKKDYFKRKVPDFYNSINFKINKIKIGFKSPFLIRNYLRQIWSKIFNSSKFMQEFYEENLCHTFPAYEISFELEKI